MEKPSDDNDVSISDVETQSGNEHSTSDNEKDNDEVHEDTQPINDKEPDNDVEIELAVDLDNPQSKNKRYDKRDFVARKHIREREPWFKTPCLFHLNQLRKRMMTNLNALLKCLGQSFSALA